MTRELIVITDCGCVFEMGLEAVEEPTDEQVVEAVTSPAIEPGVMLKCPGHGPVYVSKVAEVRA